MEKLVFGDEDKIANLKLYFGKNVRVDLHPRSSSFHFIPKFFNFFLALFGLAIATHLDLVVVSKIGG